MYFVVFLYVVGFIVGLVCCCILYVLYVVAFLHVFCILYVVVFVRILYFLSGPAARDTLGHWGLAAGVCAAGRAGGLYGGRIVVKI